MKRFPMVAGVLCAVMVIPLAFAAAGHSLVVTARTADQVSYEQAFVDLYDTLGREYPCFDLKAIDWPAVGDELLPRARQVETDEQFGLVCLELVARLEDSHAYLGKGTLNPPWPPVPRWDPGLACLIDDRKKPVASQFRPG
ncbi:MAG: hypothetical protein ABIK89_22065 [Planctomycetota bacterium]